MLKDLGGLLSDPDQHVRVAASMAIAVIDDPAAQDLTARILLQADEQMRRATAEMLTTNLTGGPHTLKDGITHQDILVRRACIYALGLIESTWSKNLLQRIQVEDSQWVIRNTAGAVLENQESTDSQVPKQLQDHYLIPWLISFANRQNEGISPTISPIPLLLKVFDYGSDEEKAAALEYLAHFPLEGVIAKIYDIVYGTNPQLRELALYTLWRLSLSGVPFPSTLKFGFT
jgi:HEAT repeat protein